MNRLLLVVETFKEFTNHRVTVSLLSVATCGSPNGCFWKWWYPQISHFNRVFHYKPSILRYPYFWKHPNGSRLSWCGACRVHRSVHPTGFLWGRFVSGEGLGFYRQVQQKFNKRNRSFLDTYIIFFWGIWNELKNSDGNYTIYLYKAIFFQKVLGTFRKTATTNDLCISFVILQKCLMKRNKNIRT